MLIRTTNNIEMQTPKTKDKSTRAQEHKAEEKREKHEQILTNRHSFSVVCECVFFYFF